MKKLLASFSYVLIFVNLFFPLCEILARLIGVQFALWNYAVSSGIVFALALIPAVVLFFSERVEEMHRTSKYLWSLLPLASVINLLFFIIKSDLAITAVFMFLNLGLSIFLAKNLGLKLAFRIASVSSIPFVLLVALVIILRPMLSWVAGDVKLKEKLVSPNGEYCVEFVERSTGASGGETMVRIYEKSFDVYVFSFREKPEILYTGAWGEDVEIEWRDNGNLLINNEEYVINK